MKWGGLRLPLRPASLPTAALVMLVVLGLLAASCRARQQAEIPTPRPEVRTLVARRESVRPQFSSFGTVEPRSKADVYATSEGRIERHLAEEGMRVESGQLLALMERTKLLISRREAAAEVESKRALLALAEQKLSQGKRDVEARLIAIESAEAGLAQKQAEYAHIAALYENKKKLYEAGGLSLEELETVKTRCAGAQNELAQARGDLAIRQIGFRAEDIAAAGYALPLEAGKQRELLTELNTGMLEAERRVSEAELSSALSQLAAVDLLLEETAVRAPIAGIIGARYRDDGERATPQDRLFTIFDTERVYVRIDVSEMDLGRISTGQTADVTLDRAPERAVKGTVKLVSPYVNPDTRTSSVRIDIDNGAGLLTPGSFVRVTLITGAAEERIVLPRSALLLDERGASTVFVVRDNRLFRQTVDVGSGAPEQAVILTGIAEGDLVCREPSPAYQDGMEVTGIP
jgi:RND family efflux transporter MFP subunit